jgi:2-isopropylmalate synthase
VPGADRVTFATHCHNDLGMATANALAAVEAGARQIECTDQRAGRAGRQHRAGRGGDGAEGARRHHAVRHRDRHHGKIMPISRMVATASGFPVQFNKAIVGKNAFAHESASTRTAC